MSCPSFPNSLSRKEIDSRKHGRVLAAHYTRIIAKPDWSDAHLDVARGGGPALDLHIHDTHFVALVHGVPKAVHSRGVVDAGAVVYLSTQYLFDAEVPAVSAVSGASSQAGRPFTHGYEIACERATLSFSFANLAGIGQLSMPVTVILPDGSIDRPDLGAGDPIDAFEAELTEAVEAIEQRKPSPLLEGTLARQALAICLAEIESVSSGRVESVG